MPTISLTKTWIQKHKIIAFIAVMILTITLTRLTVFIHNPNPTIFGFEIHHFDYGIFLLLFTCLLLLFGRPNLPLYLTMSGVAFGLIVDDFWFIRSNINDPGTNEIQIYNSTFLSVLLFGSLIIFSILLINYLCSKNSKNSH